MKVERPHGRRTADAVNLAARLEAFGKEYATSLLLSATSARALPDTTLVAEGDIAVRGLGRSVTVFTLMVEDG